MRQSRTIAQFVVATSLLATCPRAEAQVSESDAAAARLLYDEARALGKEGKYSEACPKLQDSDRLNPASDTKFWLADCYQNVGRVASAWKLFRDVADESKQQGNPTKAQYALKRAQDIVSRLPKVKVIVSDASAVAGLEIKRNGENIGKSLWGQEVPVDPGDQRITATAPGKKGWEQLRRADEGAVIVIPIPTLEDLPETTTPTTPPGAETPPPKPAVEAPAPNWTLRGAAIGVGIVGAVGTVVGGVYGIAAKVQWDEALSTCNNGERTKCTQPGIASQEGALTSAIISTVALPVGLAGLGAAMLLWMKSSPSEPKKAAPGVLVLPSIGGDRASILVHCQF